MCVCDFSCEKTDSTQRSHYKLKSDHDDTCMLSGNYANIPCLCCLVLDCFFVRAPEQKNNNFSINQLAEDLKRETKYQQMKWLIKNTGCSSSLFCGLGTLG